MYPADLRYAETHEWIRPEADDGTMTVGITSFAQDELGDVVYVDLPPSGRSVAAGQGFGSVESVKTVSDLYAPVAGDVVEVNQELATSPELINSDPYGAGWLIRLRPTNPSDVDGLLTAEAYEAHVGSH